MKKYLLLLLLSIPGFAFAQPRIEVDNVNFGTLGIGVSKTLPMQICNIGSGLMEFEEGPGGKLLEWIRTSEFRVDPDDLELLRTTPLGAGECHEIRVTFVSSVEGSFRDSAQVFTGTRIRKDYSIWTAQVRQPGARMSGAAWGERWVVTPLNQCTKDTATRYPALAEIWNAGQSDAVVASIAIVGPDRDAFALDTTNPATKILPGDIVRAGDPVRRKQALFFMPKEERPYSASLMVVTIDPLTAMRDTGFAPLSGVGIESHIGLANYDFGAVERDRSASGTVTIHALPTRQTTITDIRLADTTHFAIRTTGLPTAAAPWVLPPGTSRIIEIEFYPRVGGALANALLVSGDFSRCDASTALLIGNAVSGVKEEGRLAENRIIAVDQERGLELQLARPALVRVEIYNSAGELAESFQREVPAGRQSVGFDRTSLSSGIYHLHASGQGWSDVVPLVVGAH